MNNIDKHTDEHADGIVEDRKQAPPTYFNILFYGLIVWGVIFIAYFLLSGWSSHQEFERKMTSHTEMFSPAPLAPAGANATGPANTDAPVHNAGSTDVKELFAQYCANCHGEDGKGGFGPDLSGDYEYGKDQASIKTSITEGRSGKMPAFDGILNTEEIDALAQYILQL